MKKLLSALAATILATAFALPLNAAPMFVQKPEQVRADIVEKVKQWKKGTVIVTGVETAVGTGGRHGGPAATTATVIRAATTATVTTIRATIDRIIRATTRATIGLTIRDTTLARELAFI